MLTAGRRFGPSNLRVKLQENLHVRHVVIKDQKTEHLKIPLPSDLHVYPFPDRLRKEPPVNNCQDPELKVEGYSKQRSCPELYEGVKEGREEVLRVFGQVRW